MPTVDPHPPSRAPLDWATLCRLIRLSNQSGTLLLLWPSWWSLWFASAGVPPIHLLIIFGLGAFLMRSAGVILNDIADRGFDRQVTRTRERPLAAGTLPLRHAVGALIALLAAAGGLLALLPKQVWSLAPAAVLLASGYPLAKRVIAVPQAILGIAFGWGAVMAWASIHQHLNLSAWLVFGGTTFWAVAYDTIYAIQDRDDDRMVGVKSAALFFGDLAWVAVLVCEALFIACLVGAGWLTGAGTLFYIVLGCVAVFLSWQALQVRHVTGRDQAFAFFTQHVWVGLAILIGIAGGFA